MRITPWVLVRQFAPNSVSYLKTKLNLSRKERKCLHLDFIFYLKPQCLKNVQLLGINQTKLGKFAFYISEMKLCFIA